MYIIFELFGYVYYCNWNTFMYVFWVALLREYFVETLYFDCYIPILKMVPHIWLSVTCNSYNFCWEVVQNYVLMTVTLIEVAQHQKDKHWIFSFIYDCSIESLNMCDSFGISIEVRIAIQHLGSLFREGWCNTLVSGLNMNNRTAKVKLKWGTRQQSEYRERKITLNLKMTWNITTMESCIHIFIQMTYPLIGQQSAY